MQTATKQLWASAVAAIIGVVVRLAALSAFPWYARFLIKP
jgi:hypothetical protein